MQVTAADHGAAVTEHALWSSSFVDFLREAPDATGEEAEDGELDAPKVRRSHATCPGHHWTAGW